jgi:AraC-like DNA-binding protein
VSRFRFEMFFFGLFAAIAVGVLALVLSMQWIGAGAFYLAYATGIGCALLLVTAALLVFPEIVTDISEAAKLSYANSTLKGVDVAARLAELERVMTKDKVYRNENLNLTLLAEATGLSTHQLSELINTHFGVGFSRFVRERRVEEARRILKEDQRSSALSIGMTCGFGSQSNFYAAFKEVTGESPAAFRKRQAGGETAPD